MRYTSSPPCWHLHLPTQATSISPAPALAGCAAPTLRRPASAMAMLSTAVASSDASPTMPRSCLAEFRLSHVWRLSQDLHPHVTPISCLHRSAPVQRTMVSVGMLRPDRFSSPLDQNEARSHSDHDPFLCGQSCSRTPCSTLHEEERVHMVGPARHETRVVDSR
jgi:hypothetical protein